MVCFAVRRGHRGLHPGDAIMNRTVPLQRPRPRRVPADAVLAAGLC